MAEHDLDSGRLARRARPCPPRRVPRAAAVLVAAALLSAAAGCAGTSEADVEADLPTTVLDLEAAGPGTGAEGAGVTTTTEARGELGSGETITLAFAGDASFEGLAGSLASDPAAVLRAIGPTLSGADFSMVNLEAALTEGGTPSPKSFNFRVPPQALDALAAAGVDAVTMANNHGMDFGESGLADSLATRATSQEAPGVAVLGIGSDAADAYAPHVVEVSGQRLGVIAATDVLDASLEAAWTAGEGTPGLASAKPDEGQARLLESVAATRPEVDTLVVYLHMGVEKETCPSPRQQELAAMLHEAGVDVVIGSHAHRLQGAGFADTGFVAYGLGNFVFKASSAPARESGTLFVDVTGQRVDGFRWEPATIQGGVPVPLTGDAGAAASAAFDGLRDCAGLAAEAPAA